MKSDAQEKVLSNFNYALKKDGILFLGPSESIGDFLDAFSVVDNKWKIFKCVKSNGFHYELHENTSNFISTNSQTYWDSKFDLKDSKTRKNWFKYNRI